MTFKFILELVYRISVVKEAIDYQTLPNNGINSHELTEICGWITTFPVTWSRNTGFADMNNGEISWNQTLRRKMFPSFLLRLLFSGTSQLHACMHVRSPAPLITLYQSRCRSISRVIYPHWCQVIYLITCSDNVSFVLFVCITSVPQWTSVILHEHSSHTIENPLLRWSRGRDWWRVWPVISVELNSYNPAVFGVLSKRPNRLVCEIPNAFVRSRESGNFAHQLEVHE